MKQLLPLLTALCLVAPACDDDIEPVQERIRVDEEPPGDNCEHGGTAAHLGPDYNSNGELDDDEIATTIYTCNDPDDEVLTRVNEEPAGPNCSSGGAAVHTGADANDNDVLDDDEIAATEYVCDKVIVGDFTVSTHAEAEQLADISVITGTLTIVDAEHTNALAMNLVHIGADLIVRTDNPDLTEIRLESLVSVDGDITVESAASTLDIRSLEAISGDLLVADSAITELSLPAMTALGGSQVTVVNNPALTRVSMPGFTELDGVSIKIDDNDVLLEVTLPSLIVVRNGSILIDGKGSVTAMDLAALEEIGGDLAVYATATQTIDLGALVTANGNVSIGSHAQLQTLDIGQLELVLGALGVTDTGITVLSAPALEYAGQLMLLYNQSLTTVEVAELRGLLDRLMLMSNPLLVDLEFPRLLSCDSVWLRMNAAQGPISFPELNSVQELDVYDTGMLEAIYAPQMTRVDDRIDIRNNAALETLDFPALTEVRGSMMVQNNPSLPNLSGFAAVESIDGTFSVFENGGMTSLGLESLDSVTGSMWVGAFDVDDNDLGNANLALIDMPALASAPHLGIVSNPALTDLALSSLTDLPRLYIRANDLLPTCQADEVIAQLPPDVDAVVLDTDDSATCD